MIPNFNLWHAVRTLALFVVIFLAAFAVAYRKRK